MANQSKRRCLYVRCACFHESTSRHNLAMLRYHNIIRARITFESSVLTYTPDHDIRDRWSIKHSRQTCDQILYVYMIYIYICYILFLCQVSKVGQASKVLQVLHRVEMPSFTNKSWRFQEGFSVMRCSIVPGLADAATIWTSLRKPGDLSAALDQWCRHNRMQRVLIAQ